MAFYFFDIQSGREFFADEEGLDLPDQKSAEIEAMQTLIGMAKDSIFVSDRRHSNQRLQGQHRAEGLAWIRWECLGCDCDVGSRDHCMARRSKANRRAT